MDSPRGRGEQGKLLFADQLRGIAALCVVLSHVGGVFWFMRKLVADHLGRPLYDGPSSHVAAWVSFSHFNLGAFGVSTFFLISGFVIPFSLGKLSRTQFVVARFFRIYPTYFLCAMLTLLFYFMARQMPGWLWDLKTVFNNVILIHTITGSESIDMVNWSLAIEIKFYIVTALLYSQIRGGKIYPLVIVAFLALAANFYVSLYLQESVLWNTLANEAMMIGFMTIGVVFHYAYEGKLKTPSLLLYSAILFGIFSLTWHFSEQKELFVLLVPTYGISLLLFSACYALRRYFRNIRVLAFLANVSYPLYAVHPIVSYVVMGQLVKVLSPDLTVIVTIAFALTLAYAMHLIIEKPSIRWGRALARKIPGGGSAAPLTPTV